MTWRWRIHWSPIPPALAAQAAAPAKPDSAAAAATPKPANAYEAQRIDVEITGRKDKPDGTVVSARRAGDHDEG
jgi:hypothetical protein